MIGLPGTALEDPIIASDQFISTGETMADAGGIQSDRLMSLIQRVERLEEERAAIADDVRAVYAEAKSSGFDTKIMRVIVKLRKMEAHDREEQEQLTDLYKQAVGL